VVGFEDGGSEPENNVGRVSRVIYADFPTSIVQTFSLAELIPAKQQKYIFMPFNRR
jgi:hypothetical protein